MTSSIEGGRRSFWPLLGVAVALASAAAALIALALENPVPDSPLDGPFVSDDPLLGRCLGLINLFAAGGDPLDSSDAPLLLGAGVAALGCGLAFRLAARRR